MDIVSSLMIAATHLARFARASGVLSEPEAKLYLADAQTALAQTLKSQQLVMQAHSPGQQFIAVIRELLDTGRGHLRPAHDEMPKYPAKYGILSDRLDPTGQREPSLRYSGRCLGWFSVKNKELYVIPDVACSILAASPRLALHIEPRQLTRSLAQEELLIPNAERREFLWRRHIEGTPRSCLRIPEHVVFGG